MADVKRVYTFGNKEAEGNGKMRELLGGKGANLAEMNLIGIPVPPGFTITTEVCAEYYRHGKQAVIEMLRPEVEKAMHNIERLTGMKFGDAQTPLLVSVRSGARASMPGMMDTILNLGMNDQAVEAVSKRTGNPRFAWDSYRRFVQMYGDVVLGMKPVSKEDHDPFEEIIDALKARRGVKNDTDLTTDDLKELVRSFKEAVKRQTGEDFPACPWEQLWGAVCAVFGSWMNERAILYRKLNNIPAEWGTAVSVQAMVFGNRRGFLARCRDGREHLQRRVPDQCAGRGRRGRHPHPAADHDRRLEALGQGAEHSGDGTRREIPLARGGDARGLQGAGRDSAPPRAVLQGHAGHRVHDPGRQALDAPVPQWQAHGRSDGQDRHGHAARGADRRKDRRAALRTREARRAAAPRIRQEGHRFGTGHHEGAARLAGRGDGSRGVLRRGRREGAGQDGPEGDPGAHRDLARGPEGHARRGRNPHGARRHDLARGRRGARHGQMLRLGRRQAGDRLQGPHDQGERLHGQGGRLDLAQRLDGRGLSGSGGHEGRRPERRLRQAHGAGREVLRAEGARQRRHAEGRQAGLRVRRRGHRPVPHGAHVLRGRAAAWHWASCCRCSGATSKGCSRP